MREFLGRNSILSTTYFSKVNFSSLMLNFITPGLFGNKDNRKVGGASVIL